VQYDKTTNQRRAYQIL